MTKLRVACRNFADAPRKSISLANFGSKYTCLGEAMPGKCKEFVVFIYDREQRQRVMGSAIIIMSLVCSVEGTARLIAVIKLLRV